MPGAHYLHMTSTLVAPVRKLLFRRPTLSHSEIAFDYAGELWVVAREGGEARRLTGGAGRKTGANFSPDGKQIAFTGQYDGNVDVFVMPSAGGEPHRLTYHPVPNTALGWTPDGKKVLFSSRRETYAQTSKIYTIAANGVFADALPLSMAESGCYSPDGARIAFTRVRLQPAWKRYRGGRTSKIWLANLADSSVVQIPGESSNDFNPMWVDNKVYFLSDRNGPVSLFAYEVVEGAITEVVKSNGLDFRSASAGPGAIVYEQFGVICLFDLHSGNSHPVDIQVFSDLPAVRPRFEKLAAAKIENAGLSPTGQRAVFEAHGDIFTVPAEEGNIRNLTNSPGVADRDPSWSPDGKSIAYFSDESGEYKLHIQSQSGRGEAKKIDLGKPPSFFYKPVWSPDSKKIAYTDKRHNFWYVDFEVKEPVLIDTDPYDGFPETMSWAPDSRWIAYSKQLSNRLHAVMVYSLGEGKSTQLTDRSIDALVPIFDRSGKYLYFTASTSFGPGNGWQDMSSIDRPLKSHVCAVVLRKDDPSPLATNDEENGSEPNDQHKIEDKGSREAGTKKNKPFETRIDFDDISRRILAVPIPQRNYCRLHTGHEGVLYIEEKPLVEAQSGPNLLTVWKFDFKTRQADKILEGVTAFILSANGKKMLFQQDDRWIIADAPPQPTVPPPLKLDDLEVYVDPRAEWRQMYREVWRIERDFFYDPQFHGIDLQAAEKFYEPYLDGISTREDLTYLFEEMLGNLMVGHIFVRGPRPPDTPLTNVGLLGADYKIENGRYRIAKVFHGENWNPDLRAPLTQPGVNIVAGEYLLAVRGRELNATDNIFSLFQGTTGKRVAIIVGPDPDGHQSREVTVVPLESESGLRYLDWIEGNSRKVDQLSHGTVAYVHLPNTAEAGYTSFNRYFFAQVDRHALVLDGRYNPGGHMPDYIIDYLNRRPLSRIATREGGDFTDPMQAIYGPKVLIINEFSGSGGDTLAWYFRKAGLGPLVGMRTWGGLVAISDYPPLIDGGSVTAPRWAFYGLDGDWEVENRGISPDIEVDLDPKLVREGHDPQLERAVAVVLELMKKSPAPDFPRPSYPDYRQKFPPRS